jgi:fatty acid desaturase
MNPAFKSPLAIKQLIPYARVRNLHIVKTSIGLFAILQEWSLILATAYFCELYFSWPLYFLCLIIIGARYLALGLIMHEGVHGLISKNKTINNIAGEIFCAWPLMISMRSYGVKHLAHHAWLNTDKDPDFNAKTNPNWQYPMRFRKFIKLSILQLSGFGVFETLKVMSGAKVKMINKEKTPLYYHLLRLLFYVVIISTFLAIDQGILLLLYWIIPFATWTQFTNRMRRIAEHSGIDGKSNEMQTRTTIHSLLGRFLLSPRNISYHNEHHIYPGVPCYNLPQLHKELTRTTELKDSLHISKSYKTVFKECVIRPN